MCTYRIVFPKWHLNLNYTNTYISYASHSYKKNPLSGNMGTRLRMYKILLFKFSCHLISTSPICNIVYIYKSCKANSEQIETQLFFKIRLNTIYIHTIYNTCKMFPNETQYSYVHVIDFLFASLTKLALHFVYRSII